jgi:hypothetical protein
VYISAAILLANSIWGVIDLYLLGRTYFFLKTASYYLLTLAKTAFSLFAFYLLSSVQFKIDEKNSIDFSNQLIIVFFFSLFATFSIIESFAVKIGSFRLVDVGKALDDLKTKVADDARDKQLQYKRSLTQSIAERLSQRYSVEKLRTEFALVMELPPDRMPEELNNIARLSADTGLPLERLLAQRIANVDIRRAKELLR